MMNWLSYLLEANLYLLVFYSFYKLLLHKDTFYVLNRYYLLITSLTAFVLPFFQLGFLRLPETSYHDVQAIDTGKFTPLSGQAAAIQLQEPVFSLNHVLITMYAIVALFFLGKLMFGLFRIINMRKHAIATLENGIQLIDIKQSKAAFSFFNLLFLDQQLPEKDTILKHELAHIRQKHSIDVLLFEIIQILNWFNPIVYLIRKEVKLNHEYLADEASTKCEAEKYDYALFLIRYSSGIENLPLTNSIFSSSILKNRINMLNQKKSAGWARLKLLMVLPVTIATVCVSTMAFTKKYAAVDLFPGKSQLTQDTSKFKYSTIQKLDKGSVLFTTNVSVNKKTKKQTSTEKRLIVINGQRITNNNDFFAAAGFERKIELNPSEASSKYGDAGKNGAVELLGKNIKVLKDLPPPPPPPVEPAMSPAAKLAPPPPPVEPAPKAKPAKKLKKVAPPPPPVEPAPAKKTYDKEDVIYGDPTPEPKAAKSIISGDPTAMVEISNKIKEAIKKDIEAARQKVRGANKQ